MIPATQTDVTVDSCNAVKLKYWINDCTPNHELIKYVMNENKNKNILKTPCWIGSKTKAPINNMIPKSIGNNINIAKIEPLIEFSLLTVSVISKLSPTNPPSLLPSH